jgi:hypothetical protein
MAVVRNILTFSSPGGVTHVEVHMKDARQATTERAWKEIVEVEDAQPLSCRR